MAEHRHAARPERADQWKAGQTDTSPRPTTTTGQANSQLWRLAGGQRSRLDLTVALVGRPEVLFPDEPTAALDPQARCESHLVVVRIAYDPAKILLTPPNR